MKTINNILNSINFEGLGLLCLGLFIGSIMTKASLNIDEISEFLTAIGAILTLVITGIVADRFRASAGITPISGVILTYFSLGLFISFLWFHLVSGLQCNNDPTKCPDYNESVFYLIIFGTIIFSVVGVLSIFRKA